MDKNKCPKTRRAYKILENPDFLVYAHKPEKFFSFCEHNFFFVKNNCFFAFFDVSFFMIQNDT